MKDTSVFRSEQQGLQSQFVTEDFVLEIENMQGTVNRYDFEREMIFVGRDSWCDISLKGDEFISGRHARFSQTPKGILVEDLGSTNGILLDENLILSAYWKPDHTLRIGKSIFRLSSKKNQKRVFQHYRDSSGLLVGKSKGMRQLFFMMEKLSQHTLPVLLFGETGTGKSTIAEAIHKQGNRQTKPFVTVHCEALLSSSFESIFWGDANGEAGYIEQSKGGVLFLDEVGELSLEMQSRLLSLLSSTSKKGATPVDFRLISATHRNLLREVEEGRFLAELFEIIAGIQLDIPNLQERKEDIPLIADFLLKKISQENMRLTSSGSERLKQYSWVGNVRELQNVLERSIVFADGELLDEENLFLAHHPLDDFHKVPTLGESLDLSVTQEYKRRETPSFDVLRNEGKSLKTILEETESYLIEQALDQTDGNVKEASKILDISLPWLYKRINKYGLK